MTIVDSYLEMLYREKVTSHDQAYDEEWKRTLKQRFKESLGEFQYKPETPFKPKIKEKVDMGFYERTRVEITTIDSLVMPVYLLIPKERSDEKLPVVLAIHGHGYGSKAPVGLNPDGSTKNEAEYHKDFAVEFVKRGVIVAVPELIAFGDRKLTADMKNDNPNANSCYMIASQLLLVGKTLAGLRIYETIRLIDYLQTLQEVDPKRIGCMGISGGGLVAGFTAALDERIQATVISGYTNTFKASIMSMHHCLDNYIPNILSIAEMPDLIGLNAPRNLFIESGTKDRIFPVDQVKEAIETLEKIYQAFNAEANLSSHIFEGEHEICGEQSFDWLVARL